MTDAFVACTRFGLGARPGELAEVAHDPKGWLIAQLDGPDRVADRRLAKGQDSDASVRQIAQLRDKDARKEVIQMARGRFIDESALHLDVAASSDRPFRERLVAFWSNHFTISVARKEVMGVAAGFERDVVRAHLDGSFADMLLASTQHPAMLAYLDNLQSTGPGSLAGRRRDKGLNENLAREVLELHTVGVDGGYEQGDVQALVRLLTGWSLELESGISSRMQLAMGGDPQITGGYGFHSRRHEPGPKTLLGRSYPEGEQGGVKALGDLAGHPSTARHVATRLARHFVADDPPENAIQALEDAFRGSDGDLPTLHRALVEVAEAWEAPLSKVRRPWDLVVATARALELDDVGEGMLAGLKDLGQIPWGAPSPKGWPDVAAAWTGPEQVLGRIEWLESVVDRVPRRSGLQVAEAVYGPVLSSTTRRALEHDDDLLVALASPEFQRR